MPNTGKMTIEERRKYLKLMSKRYQRAQRAEQSHLLDEMETITGLHRKSLLQLLQPGGLERQSRRKQRGRSYDHTVDDALRVMAESLDYACAERLQPALPWLAQNLAGHGELTLTPPLVDQMQRISISTVRRILARVGQDTLRLPRKRPSRNSLAQQISMRRIPWDEATPGHFETDLVHHCGPASQGDYVHTLQMVDVATGWSERVALLGRSQRAVQAGFERILARLVFPILEIHPDNGSEFINHHLLRFFGKRPHPNPLPQSSLSEKRQPHRGTEEPHPGAGLLRGGPF
ncbi:MAG: transposase [Chloroflexi bacterium]|nr:transposase [Chloroflexota bacterium]